MRYLEALEQVDRQVYELSVREVARQASKIRLIPSENYASEAVYQASMTLFNNKYAEGYPRKRYYEGTQIIDELEDLVIERITALFQMPNANVQSYSGSPANLAAYMAILEPGEKLLGMHLPSGGHLTHGWKVTASGKLFNSCFYGYEPEKGITGIDAETGLLNYDEIRRIAERERPKLIVCGASSYPRIIDFHKFKEIADSVGAILVADIAHINGLIVAGVHPSPAGQADIITSTSHKLLRGPRGAFILSSDREITKAGKIERISTLIDKAVFPLLQGGPHFSAIAALGVALNEAGTETFRNYAEDVVKNAKRLANELTNRGFRLVTGGTDNHLMVIDTRKSFGLAGKELAISLDKAGIVCNFNAIPGDAGQALNPSGIRLGTPAITSRGFIENDMPFIADRIQSITMDSSDENIKNVRYEIAEFCAQARLAIPGVPANALNEIKANQLWRIEGPSNIKNEIDLMIKELPEEILCIQENGTFKMYRKDFKVDDGIIATIIPQAASFDQQSAQPTFIGIFRYESKDVRSLYFAFNRARQFALDPMSNYRLADNWLDLGEIVASACPS